MAVKQANRILYLDTPLGEDVLTLGAFTGVEGLSRLFSYHLTMASHNTAIEAKDIIGKKITWQVQFKEGEPRFYNGVVSRFVAGGTSDREMRSYRAEVVPWLWYLTRTSDCRIWPPGGQKKTVPQIIQMLFDEMGFTDYVNETKDTYPELEYVVQYRETAFNFVSRLMEEEGIFYFFRHEEGKHTLVLADQKSSYAELKPASLEIDSWEHQFEFRPGKWTTTDYYFKTPSTSLLTSTNTVVDHPDASKFEMFDFPGDYRFKGDGDAASTVRMEEQEIAYDQVVGSSACRDLTPGGKFTLGRLDHPGEAEEGKSYVVTYIEHSASDVGFQSSSAGAQYRNAFRCIPADVIYRAPRTTPKPRVTGAQTAVVVGPSGEEIYTDKFGRVKVQFFWDRKGTKNENSSCWIRVSQNWAGKNWGMIFNPRIGQEVVVEFLEGDPDRPIILGRVYNGEQMPPYELPANQTQSTIKTRSSKDGKPENFNELRFEDKKGKEHVYFHAEKDFHRVVENNDVLDVGFQKHDTGERIVNVHDNLWTTVGAPADDGQNPKDGWDIHYVWNSQELAIGYGEGKASDGSQYVTIYKDRDVTLETGNDKKKIKQGNHEVEIDLGDDALTIKMGNQTTKLDLGMSETEAMQSIELKVGQSSIKIDQTGVTIKGMTIKVEGTIMTEVKGVITKVSADALLQAKGAITMIG
jgi:type VI secretion system secreted protein VgrG